MLPSAVCAVIGLDLHEEIGTLYPGADGDFITVSRWLTVIAICVARGSRRHCTRHCRNIGQAGSAGYLLAIATGKGRVGLDQTLHKTEPVGYFHVTRCADETCFKPHPQIFEEIPVHTGVDAGRALMIGDTCFDLEMARNADARGLGVNHDVHSRASLLEATPSPYWIPSRRFRCGCWPSHPEVQKTCRTVHNNIFTGRPLIPVFDLDEGDGGTES